jgi:MoxR-like ATPase
MTVSALSTLNNGDAHATFAEVFSAITDNIERVIQGKREVVELALLCMLAEGHLLLEDVPGVGKTSLAKSLAASLACTWKRVQFTPDVLPTDIVGVTIWNRGKDVFEFRPGPVFANLVLGDEINRASPKTQSALLEAMEEGQVTVDGNTYPLSQPFMVIATQNPVEHEGTYPLPESQLDRFLMRVSLGYPARQAEIDILDVHASSGTFPDIGPVATAAQISSMVQASVRCTLRRRSSRTSSTWPTPPVVTRVCHSGCHLAPRCRSCVLPGRELLPPVGPTSSPTM